MPANTIDIRVGEVGVHTDTSTVVLRPSLRAMDTLGSGTAAVETLGQVFSEPANLLECLCVITACADNVETAINVFGYIGITHGKTTFIKSLVHPDDIVYIARCLLKHGMIGVPSNAVSGKRQRKEDTDSYTDKFDALDMATLAVAHLGVTFKDAWSMTMTELVNVLRTKYPENTSGSSAPSIEEHEETMAWYEEVEKLRNQNTESTLS